MRNSCSGHCLHACWMLSGGVVTGEYTGELLRVETSRPDAEGAELMPGQNGSGRHLWSAARRCASGGHRPTVGTCAECAEASFNDWGSGRMGRTRRGGTE